MLGNPLTADGAKIRAPIGAAPRHEERDNRAHDGRAHDNPDVHDE
jgi:hypothetical protein